MNLRLFVDTSALAALEDAGDSRHQEAKSFWDRVGASKTTGSSIPQTTSWARRVSKEVAANTWHHMMDSKLLRVLRVTEGIEAGAFEIFQGGPEDLSGLLSRSDRINDLDGFYTFKGITMTHQGIDL